MLEMDGKTDMIMLNDAKRRAQQFATGGKNCHKNGKWMEKQKDNHLRLIKKIVMKI